ncbi:site-specific integrase [Oceanobacillus sp. HCA-5259]|uniref:site-specific integrase n=1 Tax=Oceanobacillus sp. HCA-5259 TaxID=3134661 RepID=UPI0030C4C87B
MSKRRTFSNLVDVNVRELQYTDESDFDAYVEKFLTHSSAKNLSKETIKFYDQKLALWRNTLEELGITTDVTRCDREVIERYVDYFVNERGWKYVSVKTSLRAVKAFFNFLRNIERVIDRHDSMTSLFRERTRVELKRLVSRKLLGCFPKRTRNYLREYVTIRSC